MAKLIILVVLLTAFQQSTGITFNCTHYNTTNGTVPTFPKAFSTQIEAKFLDKNVTFTMFESYDYDANAMVIEWKGMKQITDFELKEYRLINITTNRCINISSLPSNATHMPVAKGSHIGGSAKLFHFGKEYGEKFIGKTSLRDIPCNQWQSCQVTNHSSYLINYYFTDTQNPAPIRCEVIGEFTPRHHGGNGGNASWISMHHIYDFFDFKNEKPRKQVFQAPPGTACKSLSGQPRLPKLSDHVMYAVEYHERKTPSHSSDTVKHAKIYYDFEHHIYRSDHYTFTGFFWQAVTEIHDEEQGLVYFLNSPTKCNIRPLKHDVYTGERIDDHINLEAAFLHMRKNRSSYTFEGHSVVRGMDADVWIWDKKQTTDGGHFNRLELYFSNENVSVLSLFSSFASTRQALVRIVGYYGNTANVLFNVELFHYDDKSHMLTSIKQPISRCLRLGASLYTVTFFINDPTQKHMERLNEQTDLVEKIERIFANFSEVPVSRFSVELVTTSQSIDVRLSVFGWPKIEATKPKGYMSAEQIADRIKKGVLNFDIELQYNDDTGRDRITHIAKFKRKYFDGVTMEMFPKTVCKNESNKTGLIVALSILFFVLGLLVMLTVLNIVLRKNDISLRSLVRPYAKFGKKKEANGTKMQTSPQA